MGAPLVAKKQNILSICGSEDKTYTISTSFARQKITFNTEKFRLGNKLTMSNNSIVIGKDISKIKISGLFGSWNSASSGIEIYIYKNEEEMQKIYWTKSNKDDTDCIALPELYIDVSEGDLISLRFSSGITGNYTIFERASVSFLSVEVIE